MLSYLVPIMALRGRYNLNETEEATQAQGGGRARQVAELRLRLIDPFHGTPPKLPYTCAGLRRLPPEAGLLGVWAWLSPPVLVVVWPWPR